MRLICRLSLKPSRQEHLPDASDMHVGFFCALSVRVFSRSHEAPSGPCCSEGSCVLRASGERHPEGFLDLFSLAVEQRLRREGMARMTPKSFQIRVVHFPKNAPTVGAVVGNLAAEGVHLCN